MTAADDDETYLSAITVTNSYEFYLQDGSKNQLAQIRWEISVRLMVVRVEYDS